MKIRESIIKLQKKLIIMLAEFVTVSFIFILAVSFIFFFTQEPDLLYCNNNPWPFGGIPCHPIYGELVYREVIPFMFFFLLTFVCYVIFIIGVLFFMIIYHSLKTRRIDRI